MQIRLTCLTAMLLSLTLPPSATAQTTVDKEQAKALVAEGRRLRDEKDHAGALARFKAAWALIKTPIIGLDLARAHETLGEFLAAYGICDEVGRMPPKETESVEAKKARAATAALAKSLEPRIPKLTIKLQPQAATSRPVVILDGVELPAEALLGPRLVDPGLHEVIVRVEGAAPTRSIVTLTEGASRELVLTVPEVPPANSTAMPSPESTAMGSAKTVAVAAPSKTAASPPLTRSDDPSGGGWRITGLVVGGAGVLALGVGGVLALAAKSKADAAQCDANDVCASRADVDQRAAAVQQANVATIVVGLGGALAVGGALLWLTAPSEGKSAKGVTTVGVGATGFTIAGSF